MYTGDGKLFFKVTGIIEQSNISEEDKRLVLDEYEKMSLNNQHINNSMGNLVCEFEKIKKILDFAENKSL
jgi:hypothetical protein